MIPAGLQPATWGCSHGTGWIGDTIRKAELAMSASHDHPYGDRQASWAAHCFVYIGTHDFGNGFEGAIVEAEWPKVKLSPASAHADACWAIHQPLSQAQRAAGRARVLGLAGEPYDWQAFLWYTAELVHVRISGDPAGLFGNPKVGPICSGVVVREQEAMGVDLGPLRTAATSDPDYVCPADVLRWGLNQGWMSSTPPQDWQ